MTERITATITRFHGREDGFFQSWEDHGVATAEIEDPTTCEGIAEGFAKDPALAALLEGDWRVDYDGCEEDEDLTPLRVAVAEDAPDGKVICWYLDIKKAA